MSQLRRRLGWSMAGLLAVNGLWSTYRASVGSNHVLRGRQRAVNPPAVGASAADRQPRLYVVLPMLHEAAFVPHIARHWLNHVRKHPELSICVVTSERERLEAATGEPFTWEALELDPSWQTLRSTQNARQIHFPSFNRTYAEQLRWGLDEVAKAAAPDSYFYVSNADSRLDSEAVAELTQLAASGTLPVSQQSTLFLRNLSDLSWIASGEALYQTRWTLEVEIFRYLAGSGRLKWLPKAVIRRWYQHAVGHGLLVSMDAFRRLDGFDVPRYGLEDASFGVKVRIAGQSLNPLDTVEWGEGPRNVQDLMRQRGTWVRGPLCAWEYAAPSGRWDLAAQGTWDGLKWALGLPALTLMIVLCPDRSRKVAIGGVLTGYAGPLLVLLRALRIVGDQPDMGFRVRDAMRATTAYPVASLTYWLGGFLGLLRLADDVRTDREFVQVPTRGRQRS